MIFNKTEWRLFLFLVMQMPEYEGKDNLIWRLEKHITSMGEPHEISKAVKTCQQSIPFESI